MRTTLCQTPLPAGGLSQSRGILPVHGAQTGVWGGVWSGHLRPLGPKALRMPPGPGAVDLTATGSISWLSACLCPFRDVGNAELHVTANLQPRGGSVERCLAPGILWLLLGLRGPARNRAETGKQGARLQTWLPFSRLPIPSAFAA